MTKLAGVRIVADAKVTRYLLAQDHPIGGAKARFFLAFGFDPDVPEAFATAILMHADMHPVHAERKHARGVNREVRCNFRTPDGRNPCIVTVWFQAAGESTQRLITAYPT